MKIEDAKSILMNNLILEVSTAEADKDYTDALNEGIKALEKQIAKPIKPDKRIPGIGKCPVCKTELCYYAEDQFYCTGCGQLVSSPK